MFECRGRVVHGQCTKCNEIVMGVPSYLFHIVVADRTEEADRVKIDFPVSNGGAKLFGMPAGDFLQLGTDKRIELTEQYFFRETIIKVAVSYKLTSDSFDMWPYEFYLQK